MKRILALMAVLALVTSPAVAGAQTLISGALAGYKISATATNTVTTFATTSGASTGISVYNSGAVSCWVKVNAVAVADSTSVEIPAGAAVALSDFAATSLGTITAAGTTATVYVYVTSR